MFEHRVSKNGVELGLSGTIMGVIGDENPIRMEGEGEEAVLTLVDLCDYVCMPKSWFPASLLELVLRIGPSYPDAPPPSPLVTVLGVILDLEALASGNPPPFGFVKTRPVVEDNGTKLSKKVSPLKRKRRKRHDPTEEE